MSNSSLLLDELGPRGVVKEAAVTMQLDMKVRVKRNDSTTHMEVSMMDEYKAIRLEHFKDFDEVKMFSRCPPSPNTIGIRSGVP